MLVKTLIYNGKISPNFYNAKIFLKFFTISRFVFRRISGLCPTGRQKHVQEKTKNYYGMRQLVVRMCFNRVLQ